MRLPPLFRSLWIAILCLFFSADAFAQLIARPGPIDPDPPHPGRPVDDFLDKEPEHPCPEADGNPVFNFASDWGNAMHTPAGVIIGDPDGDGKADVTWSAIGQDTFSMVWGFGFGRYNYPIGFGATDLAYGNFDNDEHTDLIATNMNDDTVTIRWGIEGGNEVFEVGDGPTRVEAGDLNGDGYVDFVTLDILSNTLTVRLRDSDKRAFSGSFDSTTIPIGESNDLKLADMDNDGDLDLVYPSGIHNATVKYRRNDGNANFGDPVTIQMGSGHAETFHGIAIGDLNDDGRLDVVASRSSHELVRVLATGPNTFGPPAAIPTGNNPFQIVMDDLDLDGNLDFALTHLNNSFISVYLGHGDGNVEGPWTYDVPGLTYGIASGDVNGDGIPDLAVTAGEHLHVLQTVCPGDDGDIGDKVVNPPAGGKDPGGRPTLEPFGDEGGKAPPPTREPATRFRRGDVDQSADLDLADGVRVLNWLFFGGSSPTCEKAADSNDSGATDIADVSFLLNFLFLGGPALPAPGGCGVDPTVDGLTCESYDVCVR